MPLSVGGGVRAVEDARRLLRSGADKVSVNTAAVEEPDLIAACADAFGSQCVVAAIDAKSAGPGRWGGVHLWRPQGDGAGRACLRRHPP